MYPETTFSLVEIDLTKIYCAFIVAICLANLDQMRLKTAENMYDSSYVTRHILGLVPSPPMLIYFRRASHVLPHVPPCAPNLKLYKKNLNKEKLKLKGKQTIFRG